ncbi:hypothetical protein NQK81_35850 [Amycolatopsis roodepoortensis]|nr:hypothetical protein NQK81_35850 [Amycolatopsis roodepoortensis]
MPSNCCADSAAWLNALSAFEACSSALGSSCGFCGLGSPGTSGVPGSTGAPFWFGPPVPAAEGTEPLSGRPEPASALGPSQGRPRAASIAWAVTRYWVAISSSFLPRFSWA